MEVLSFGSYATIYKKAICKPDADKIVVPLLFEAIEKNLCDLDNADCQKWRKATKKLPSYIVSPSVSINTLAVEKYFEETILPKLTDGNKKDTFHQYLYTLVVQNTDIDKQQKDDLTDALINKQYAYFDSQVFLYAISQSNTSGVNLDGIELLSLPTAPKLEKTIYDKDFDRVFIPVSHNSALDTVSDCIRLFRLDVINSAIVFDNLNDFLEKNIGRYVFSRATRDKLVSDGHSENIGKKAVEILKKAGGFDKAQIGEELGDIILYILLEQNLNAPKVYNKIELVSTTDNNVVNQGGVHLLTLDSAESKYKVIVAKSNVVGDLRTAIDNAFSVIVTANKNTTKEYKLLDASVLNLSFEPQIAEYLRSIIIPTKRKVGVSTSNAFAVFLGYSIGVNSAQYNANDFPKAVEAKMAEDIQNQIDYIKEKIAAENLNGYTFYFYLIPFNDADCEKITIMQNLVGGDV